jgi:hypothetical protein
MVLYIIIGMHPVVYFVLFADYLYSPCNLVSQRRGTLTYGMVLFDLHKSFPPHPCISKWWLTVDASVDTSLFSFNPYIIHCLYSVKL